MDAHRGNNQCWNLFFTFTLLNNSCDWFCSWAENVLLGVLLISRLSVLCCQNLTLSSIWTVLIKILASFKLVDFTTKFWSKLLNYRKPGRVGAEGDVIGFFYITFCIPYPLSSNFCTRNIYNFINIYNGLSKNNEIPDEDLLHTTSNIRCLLELY